MLGYCSRCCKHFSLFYLKPKIWVGITKVPESSRHESVELCAFLWEAGRTGVRTAPPHGKTVSVVTSLMLTVLSLSLSLPPPPTHIHSPWKYHKSSDHVPSHMPTYSQHSGYPSLVLHASPSWEEVTRRHDTTICSLHSTNGWQELQGPNEATAQHSCSDSSPGDSGSGKKAPLRTSRISITPCCSNFYAPHF